MKYQVKVKEKIWDVVKVADKVKKLVIKNVKAHVMFKLKKSIKEGDIFMIKYMVKTKPSNIK